MRGARFAATCLVAGLLLAGCAPQSRMGMVLDRETGLQFGSVSERSFVVDAAQFEDRRLKLRLRNTSGDPAFDLDGLRQVLASGYRQGGYEVDDDGEYGLLLDVNVVYSGQVTQNLSEDFAFLGAAAGGLASYGATRGELETAAGTIAGASLGHVLGTYQKEETFIVVALVTLGLVDKNRGITDKKIVFGKSADERSRRVTEFRPFRDRASTRIAVFAGGTNISQDDIADGVRRRFQRILADVI